MLWRPSFWKLVKQKLLVMTMTNSKPSHLDLVAASANKDQEYQDRLPVVVILGSTATGKSKLAIDLALKFNGEVISADSMQVYTGLDILTNKATKEEMQGVPHHMIGVVDRTEKFDVVQFRNQALPLVEKVLNAGKIPFIVGGTNYYIESLLWEVLISESTASRKRKADDKANSLPPPDISQDLLQNPILLLMSSRGGHVHESEISNWSNQELYAALQIVDPERISKLHPNDRRKSFRSLQVRFQTGRKHSELIAEQCLPLAGDVENEPNPNGGKDLDSVASPGKPLISSALGGPLRFPRSLCLWIQADKQLLQERIDERVDEMLKRGLKQELDSYMDILRDESSDLNYEEGVLQSIGFKEFHSYLQLAPSERESAEGEKLLLEGVERLKVVTKQYAKKQVKWVNQRFLLPHRRQLPPVYKLDGNLVDPINWETNVTTVGINILEAFLKDEMDATLLMEKRVLNDVPEMDDLVARICEVCNNRVFIGTRQWEAHLASSRHMKMRKRKENPNSSDYVKMKAKQ